MKKATTLFGILVLAVMCVVVPTDAQVIPPPPDPTPLGKHVGGIAGRVKHLEDVRVKNLEDEFLPGGKFETVEATVKTFTDLVQTYEDRIKELERQVLHDDTLMTMNILPEKNGVVVFVGQQDTEGSDTFRLRRVFQGRDVARIDLLENTATHEMSLRVKSDGQVATVHLRTDNYVLARFEEPLVEQPPVSP